MSSALYIILDRKIPGADTFVDGKSLARLKFNPPTWERSCGPAF
jgi:hypothetical protein